MTGWSLSVNDTERVPVKMSVGMTPLVGSYSFTHAWDLPRPTVTLFVPLAFSLHTTSSAWFSFAIGEPPRYGHAVVGQDRRQIVKVRSGLLRTIIALKYAIARIRPAGVPQHIDECVFESPRKLSQIHV